MSDMKDLIADFQKQLQEAIEIGEKSSIRTGGVAFGSVVITGLGGSGIGGTIVSEIVAHECRVPIAVNKDYFLPAFVNEHTLVIVCSYSGNTEETIQAMEEALRKKAVVVCITSGGKIAEMAKANSCSVILIPPGNPPRASLGYSLTQLFYVLHAHKLISGEFKKHLQQSINLLQKEEKSIIAEAKKVADFLYGKTPVLYAVDGYNGVATRFRQQINENSKMLCWHHIIPEMNHNELVGWAGGSQEFAVVILRNKADYSRSQARIEINKEIILKYTPHLMEIWSKGDYHLERALYLIHLTDWVSWFLADKQKIDATEVNVINHLKGALAKI